MAWTFPGSSEPPRLRQRLSRLPAWPVYPLAVLPVIWLFWQGATGRIGIEPVEAVEHRLGLWALWALLAGLAVTPLRRLAGLNLMRFRRAIGLVAFFYLCCHLLTWAVLDVQGLAAAWADIVRRPYVTVGMAGLLLLLPLAATSWNGAIRRMGGRAWRRLHRLVYPAVLLGAVHFVMLRKGWQLEPLLYLGLAIVLIAARFLPTGKRSSPNR
ncbi:protein-methionine-sulfoxide reductase heme-binding subunit MsrQ [Mangrovicoccus algicola]|uniref:Protein-methionine-sulfoxide reductase heme-binding subunit MsrQ n=1 Tax=Mangrovicoccus algicola TaxID=2771008 RepID=A0A8J6YZX7_9RHOB|nr:protein-methionine-sulfoxide reductase heme-binding subunit MsrQ [Mangrovicoccus algicola]MBE3640600.1 protein-methionine-sulfoxide reductase heme-binding subunit MsrQ [Mangrovicoccus algicola]